MSVKKKFDRNLYELNDKLAKKGVYKALKKTGITVVENCKKTQVDMLVFIKNNHVINIEAEIKRVWKGPQFQYDSVQIPERKEKFAKLDKPTLFVMFNEDQSEYLVIKDKDLLSSPKIEVPNKYVFKGELFFQVPVSKVSFNNLKQVIEEVINDN